MPDLTPDVTTTPNFDPGRISIMSGWLVYDVGYHTCGGYDPESGYAHEPGCGAEPMCKVADIPDLLAAAAERDALAAKVERVRALHRPAYNDVARSPMCEDCGGKAGVHPCGCWAEDDYEFVCAVCNQGTKNQSVPWPCPTVRALDEEPQP